MLINVNFLLCFVVRVEGVCVVCQGFYDYVCGMLVEGCDLCGFFYFWFGFYGIEQMFGYWIDFEVIVDGFVLVMFLQFDLIYDVLLVVLVECYVW